DKRIIYVGKTDQTLDGRVEQHKQAARSGSRTPFHRMLISKGIDNWHWEPLERCAKARGSACERIWIKKLNALSIEGQILIQNVVHCRKTPSATRIIPNKLGSLLGGYRVWKTQLSRALLISDGKLKPVINLVTKTKYKS